MASRRRSSRSARRQAPVRQQPWWRRYWPWLAGGAGLAVLAVVLVVSLNGGGSDASNGANPGVSHIHGLAVDSTDGSLYAGTHFGLYRIEGEGEATLVSERTHDFMGFSIVDSNRFVASGHPDAETRDELPPLLGLIESSDRGQTWQSRSLLGEADFHSLEFVRGSVYGYNSSAGVLMVSNDDGATWEARGSLPMADFAVIPTGGDEILVAATQEGVQRSTDGGQSWEQLGGTPLVFLDWEDTGDLWGIDSNGAVMRSTDGGETWEARGAIGQAPAALLAVAGKLYAADQTGTIYQSDDSGATWRVIFQEQA